MFLPKPLDIFPPEGGCSEGLDTFRFFLKTVAIRLTLTIFLAPNKKNVFGPFSYKFFVPIRVGYALRFFLPGGVFLPCDHGWYDFDINFYNNSMYQYQGIVFL